MYEELITVCLSKTNQTRISVASFNYFLSMKRQIIHNERFVRKRNHACREELKFMGAQIQNKKNRSM